ncbi:MAG: hypothetical protein SR1Q5_09295 [Quinella sp. 1Q5]|nr:hypothetical protein [Quinella sp. 1Q5]
MEKRHKSKLFYESALDKIKKDRKRLEERPRRERISNIAELEIKELKHQIDSLKKENEELKKKLNNLGIL